MHCVRRFLDSSVGMSCRSWLQSLCFLQSFLISMLLLRGQSGRGWEGLDPTFKVQTKDSCKVEDSYLTSYAAIMGGLNARRPQRFSSTFSGFSPADSKLCLCMFLLASSTPMDVLCLTWNRRHSYQNCPHTNDGRCPTIYGDRKWGIVKTCINCFKGDRALHKYRYGNKNYPSWRPADGGQFMLNDHVSLFEFQSK